MFLSRRRKHLNRYVLHKCSPSPKDDGGEGGGILTIKKLKNVSGARPARHGHRLLQRQCTFIDAFYFSGSRERFAFFSVYRCFDTIGLLFCRSTSSCPFARTRSFTYKTYTTVIFIMFTCAYTVNIIVNGRQICYTYLRMQRQPSID